MNDTQTAASVPEQEKVKYDCARFPLYIVKATLAYFPNLSAVCHWHEDFEFLVILDGHMDYNVNGVVRRLDTNDGVFVNSKQLHYGYSADGADCTYLCLLLTPAIVQGNPYLTERFLVPLAGNRSFPAALLRPECPWQQTLLEQLRRIYQIYQEKQTGFELEIGAGYLQVLALLCRNMPRPPAQDTGLASRQSELQRMQQMLQYAETHLADDVSLEQLSGAANVCGSTCCSLFRRYLGQSPMQYLTALRLERSCTLLRETQLSVTEIAFRTGFSGSSYFAERFRQQYGCSPRAFRRSTRQNEDV